MNALYTINDGPDRLSPEDIAAVQRYYKRLRLGRKVAIPADLADGARPRIPPKAAGRMPTRRIPADPNIIHVLKPRIGWARARRATCDPYRENVTFHDGRVTRTLPRNLLDGWARGELTYERCPDGTMEITRVTSEGARS